jgi:chromosome segregation ATPase
MENQTALTILPETDAYLFKQVVQRAESYLCVAQKEYDYGAESLALAKLLMKKMDDTKKEQLRPLNEQISNIRAKFAPFEDKIKAITTAIQSEMSRWLRQEQERVRKLEAEKEKKIEEERQRQLKAAEEGKKIRTRKLPERLRDIETPSTRVETVAGGLSTRSTLKWRVTDLKLIPDEYTEKIPSKAKIDAAAKQIDANKMASVLGKIIPGIEFYVDTTFVRR